ncbi:MAG: histidine phosphatase family protein [Clostridiales bacterium]|nr:histidine phosphatase family protein [Clostridiales bacterium]
MKIFIIRHGSDIPGYRGGWSSFGLSEDGVAQAGAAAEYFKTEAQAEIDCIYSSDLTRARQTAEIIAGATGVSVVYLKAFREVNNGALSGMENETAKRLFPNIYWKTLGWNERYPGGESPAEFYARIKNAWFSFKNDVQLKGKDVILVTHGGVMQVIYSLLGGVKYTNSESCVPLGSCDIIKVEYSSKSL